MENLPWPCSPSNNERFVHPHFSTRERWVQKNILATVISEDSQPDHIMPASSDWYVFRTCPHHVNSPVKNETNKYHLRDWSSWHLWRDHGGECWIPVLSSNQQRPQQPKPRRCAESLPLLLFCVIYIDYFIVVSAQCKCNEPGLDCTQDCCVKCFKMFPYLVKCLEYKGSL